MAARRLNVGCGWDRRPGYVNVDFAVFHEPDLVADVRRLPMGDASVDEVVAQDVLEHLPRGAAAEALAEWARVLRPGGTLVLRVPDLVGLLGLFVRRPERAAQEELVQCLYGTQAYDGDYHQNGFTEVVLRHHLHDAGFVVESLSSRDEWLFDAVARRVPDPGPLALGPLPFMQPRVVAPTANGGGVLAQAVEAARRSSDVDVLDPGPTRLRAAKRLALRMMRPLSSRQAAHNRAVTDALALIERRLDEPPRAPTP